MNDNIPLLVDTAPTVFAGLVAVDDTDNTAIFRLKAADQFNFSTSETNFKKVRPKVLDESNEIVGKIIDSELDATNKCIELHCEFYDANVKQKLAGGVFAGIHLPVKTANNGKMTIPIGAARLSDTATRTAAVESNKMFKVVREDGKVEKRPFVHSTSGVGSDSIAMIKAAHARGPDRLDPDGLAKAARSEGVTLDATARAILKTHQGDSHSVSREFPPISANGTNDNVRTPPKRPNAEWNGSRLPPGHADLTRRPESDPTISAIKLAHTQPKSLRG